MLQALIGPLGNLASSWLQGKADAASAAANLKLVEAEAKATIMKSAATSEADWERISTGLIQRAELLEMVVADIYGDNNLVQQGLLPPELVAQNSEFLRPLVGELDAHSFGHVPTGPAEVARFAALCDRLLGQEVAA